MSTWDILYVATMEIRRGLAETEVLDAIAREELSAEDCVRKSGEEKWVRIGQVKALRSRARTKQAKQQAQLELLDSWLAGDAIPVKAAPQEPKSTMSDLMAFRHHRVEQGAEIDMAPAATLALLLILFFVVASSVILQKSLPYPVPSPNSPTTAAVTLQDLKDTNIIVEINADNSILVDDEPAGEMGLAAKLRKIRLDRAVTDLLIKPHEQSYHRTVVAVIQAAREASIANIKMAAARKGGSRVKRQGPSLRKS